MVNDNAARQVNEHPEPTAGTVKKLYANAFRCAHPDCSRPLYRQDNETGDQILNSRVAHIHARRRGGPRWIAMDSQTNRAAPNLVLLCLEHAHEVDDFAHRFPADTLRSWKAAQLAEHQQILRNWTLTDEQAAEVQHASFRAQAQAHVDAASLAALARATEAVSNAARRLRAGPQLEADRARQTWARVRRQSLPAWDAHTGELLPAPPPAQIEQDAHHAAMSTALQRVSSELVSIADRVREEVAALRVARPDASAWCDWVVDCTVALVQASATWPGPLPAEDDGRVEQAREQLARAARALDRRIRGVENVELPPEPAPEQIEPEPEPDRLFAVHCELLDEARPFGRVDTRPYDPDLRQRVAQASAYASMVAPTLTQLPFGLEATAWLAARIARNASPDELHRLAEEDRERRPISAAVLLVTALAQLAFECGHTDVAEALRALVVGLFKRTDWTAEESWTSSEVYGAAMLNEIAAASSVEEVRAALADTLGAAPQRAAVMLLSCAQWVERLPHHPGGARTAARTYRSCPGWLPAHELLAAYENTIPSHDRDPEQFRLAEELGRHRR